MSGEARRQFDDAVKSARRYLDSAEKSKADPKAAFDYLISAAEAIGSSFAHMSYLTDVSGKALAKCRGLQDRLLVLKKRFVAQPRSPVGRAESTARLKRRLT
jgi:hypothetical protein